WVELSRSATQFEYVRVMSRPMVTLRIDCKKEAYPTRAVTKLIRETELKQAIVRIIIQLTPETNASVKDSFLRRELLDAGVFHIAGIIRDIERPDRARLGTNPEGLTHEELLEKYLISREIEPDRRAVLMEKAEEIMKPQ